MHPGPSTGGVVRAAARPASAARRALAAGAAVAGLLLAPAASPASERGEAYAALATRWIKDPMGARNELLRWSDWDLRAGVLENRTNRRFPRAAAAMLHTELSLEAARHAPVTAERQMLLAEEHVQEMGRDGEGFRTGWLRLRALTRLETYDVTGARDLLEPALQERQVPPELILTMGITWELEAKITASDVAARPESPLAAGAEARRHMDVRRINQLEKALELYERVVERDPGSDEAVFRVARIRLLLGDREPARPALDRLVESREADLRYLALLLRARERERDGHPELAEVDYRAARRLVPLSQAARIGQAALQLAAGTPAAAGALLLDGLEARRAHPIDVDPWWLYPQGRVNQLRVLILGLRKQARAS